MRRSSRTRSEGWDDDQSRPALGLDEVPGVFVVIEPARVRELNDRPLRDQACVLYWMQQSQRVHFNPALELAARLANDRGLGVVVGFGLTEDYPEANERHFAFMLEGLREVERDLSERRIKLVVRRGSPEQVAIGLARDAALVVCDRGYLRHQKRWRERVAAAVPCRVIQVEGDVVVPIEEVSDKPEFAARTIRAKVERLRDGYLKDLSATRVREDSRSLCLQGDVNPSDVESTLAALSIDRKVRRVRRFRGGTSEARRLLTSFLRRKLDGYAEDRGEPASFQCSFMSPYLHFGQISPVEIALKVRDARSGMPDDRAAYLEELIVRRELATNLVHFRSEDYDHWRCLPEWARSTLAAHRADPRLHVYNRSQLEACATHDEYWNAAMREMVHTGFMHNYMRMYWGKKILEWSRTPEEAYRTALRLNNRYFLDGRDPNSFANVAWCFGLHDRPWAERSVFGTVRYMNATGLERKFDMEAYVRQIDRLVEAEGR